MKIKGDEGLTIVPTRSRITAVFLDSKHLEPLIKTLPLSGFIPLIKL